MVAMMCAAVTERATAQIAMHDTVRTEPCCSILHLITIPYAWKCSREEIFANFANDVTFANIYFANISHLRTSYTRVLLYFGVISYNVSCFRRRHVEDD